MRKIFFLIMGTVMCACASKQNAGGEGTPMPQDSTHIFAANLFKTVNSNTDKENFCISPASAMWALAMTANGADGTTAKQMYVAMGYPAAAEHRTSFNTLQKSNIAAAEQNEKAEVNIANSIWIKNSIKLKETFIKENKLYYDAEVKHTTFDDATVAKINNWCSEKTNGKIKSIISRSDPATLLMLINAIYFKAQWAHPFGKSQTRKAPFTKAGGEVVEVDMMCQTRSAKYYEDSIMQATIRPFIYNEYSMTLILPRQGADIEKIADRCGNIATKAENRLLQLEMPKFKNEFDTSLKTTLQSMGIENAFTDDADFSGISKTPVRIDDVIQKTYIAVDEQGAEAAAVTAVQMVAMSAMRPQERKTMIIDRPFIYTITDNRSGEILFIGKVGNPNATEN